MTSDIKEKSEEQLEKRILLLSFLTGVGFVRACQVFCVSFKKKF